MREVAIIGIGQTAIGELWSKSLRELAGEALSNAMRDSGIDQTPDALYIGNMMASRLSNQAHLGALVADYMRWQDIEATTVEAACASGGAAFQAGVRAVKSGDADVVAVCGVEKMTDSTTAQIISALATAADAEFEGIQGATFVGLNAMIMRRYMHEYGYSHEHFAPFAVTAHSNALNNPNAMFKMKLTAEGYKKSPMVADPIGRFDSAPICDGAAAVILCPMDMVRDLSGNAPVRVLASVTVTDTITLGDRTNMLDLRAARVGAEKAYRKAGISAQDVDIFELHDAFSIMAALSLEAAGFAQPGKAIDLAERGEIALDGSIPICTMGGLKARGHPVGATGVYEILDLVTQLRGEAGVNQVRDAEIGLTQNIGGTGSTVVTHILSLS